MILSPSNAASETEGDTPPLVAVRDDLAPRHQRVHGHENAASSKTWVILPRGEDSLTFG
jgi:hypothetical protein